MGRVAAAPETAHPLTSFVPSVAATSSMSMWSPTVFASLFSPVVPVMFSLPGSPVFLDMAVGHTLITGRNAPVRRRQADQGSWHPSGADGAPRPIVTIGDIPSSPVRPIPVPVIEKNIYIDIGRIIHIGAGYHDQGRWRWNDQSGQGNSYTNVHLGVASCRNNEAERHKNGDGAKCRKQ